MPQSHTTTRQWQSFELRMRQRRLELCGQRARAALAAGRLAEARQAIDEALLLDPEHAPSRALADRLPAVAAHLRARRSRVRRTAVAAAVLLTVSGVGWHWSRSPAPIVTSPDVVVALQPPVTPRREPELPLTLAEPDAAPPAPLAAVETAATAPTADDVAPSAGTSARAAPPIGAPPPSPEPRRETTGTAGVRRQEPPAPRRPAAGPVVRSSGAPIRPAPVAALPSTSPETPSPEPPAPPAPAALVSSAEPPPAPRPAPATPAREMSPAPVSSERVVRDVLNRYQTAYSNLDAAAAGAVWPSVDTRALARAFDGLASQRVSFGHCDVEVRDTSATADCRGQARWTPKVGGGTQTADRRWRFELAQQGEAWVITQATVR